MSISIGESGRKRIELQFLRKWSVLTKLISDLDERSKLRACMRAVFILEQIQLHEGPLVDWTPLKKFQFGEGFLEKTKTATAGEGSAAYGTELLGMFLVAQAMPGIGLREVEVDGAEFFRDARLWAEKIGLDGLSEHGCALAEVLVKDAIARRCIAIMIASRFCAKTPGQIIDFVIGRPVTDTAWHGHRRVWERAWRTLPPADITGTHSPRAGRTLASHTDSTWGQHRQDLFPA